MKEKHQSARNDASIAINLYVSCDLVSAPNGHLFMHFPLKRSYLYLIEFYPKAVVIGMFPKGPKVYTLIKFCLFNKYTCKMHIKDW